MKKETKRVVFVQTMTRSALYWSVLSSFVVALLGCEGTDPERTTTPEDWTLIGSEEGAGFGTAITGGLDVNGDGASDVCITAFPRPSMVPTIATFGSWEESSGTVRVCDGRTWTTIHELRDPSPGFGTSVAMLGDLDGDGCAEVAVGAPRTDVDRAIIEETLTRRIDGGHVDVYSGKSGGLLRRIEAESGDLWFGERLCSMPSSSIEDPSLLIGSSMARDKPGSVHLYSAASGDRIRTFTGTQEGECFGASIATVGDVDEDGTADIAVGSRRWSDPAARDVGRVQVLSLADGRSIWERRGESAFDGFGTAVACVGDSDGDGMADLLVGATGRDENGDFAGCVYLLSGRTGATLGKVCGAAGDQLGEFVSGVPTSRATSVPEFLLCSIRGAEGSPGRGYCLLLSGLERTLVKAEGSCAMVLPDAADDESARRLAIGIPGDRDDRGAVRIRSIAAWDRK